MRNFTEQVERIGKGREWTQRLDTLIINNLSPGQIEQIDRPIVTVTESAHVEKLMRVLRGMAKVCDAAAAWVESDEIPCPNCSMYEPGDNVPCECDVIVGIQMRDQDTTKRALAALAREMEEVVDGNK